MRVLKASSSYPLLFLDLLRKATKARTLSYADGMLLIEDAELSRLARPYVAALRRGNVSVEREIKALTAAYAKAGAEQDLGKALAAAMPAVAGVLTVEVLHEAARIALLAELRVPDIDRYYYYQLFSTPQQLSRREEQEADLLSIALLVERNKTLKKSFTSSPEKIREKIRTFYINIYNRILQHVRRFGWTRTTPASFQPYEELDIIRDVKTLIKQANIKRVYADLAHRDRLLKREIRKAVAKGKLSRKVQRIGMLAGQIAHLRRLGDEYLSVLFFRLRPLFAHIAEVNRMECGAVLSLSADQLRLLMDGKAVRPKQLPVHLHAALGAKAMRVRPLTRKLRQEIFRKLTIVGVTNFSGRLKAEATLAQEHLAGRVLVLPSLGKPSELILENKATALAIDAPVDVLSNAYHLIRGFPAVIGTDILSRVAAERERLVIDGTKGLVKRS